MANAYRDSFAPPAPTVALAAFVTLAVGFLATPVPPANAGSNVDATLPLHAIENAIGECDIDDPCDPGPPTTAFDALGGGETAVVGRIHFIAGHAGCLSQIDSSHPNGSHLVSSSAEIDAIDSWESTGSVCTDWQCRGSGDAFYVGQRCDEIECVNPVEQVTWGQIKALHRD